MKEEEIMRSVLPYRWSSNDRYQLVREEMQVGFAFKPIAAGWQYLFGSILAFGLICPVFFIGFWFLAGRAHIGPIALIGGITCLLGPIVFWTQWKQDAQRKQQGPLWAFDGKTGRLSNSRMKIAFHRDQLLAVQQLAFHSDGSFIQVNFVVNQTEGQLPRRFLMVAFGQGGECEGMPIVREFLCESSCGDVPVLHHEEARGYDIGYALVDWIKGKKK